MSQIGMSQQSDEQRHLFEDEAVRIVKNAAEQGLTLRLLGSLAFHLHCQRYERLQKQLGRAYTDIDFAGYKTQASQIGKFLAYMGYKEDPEINILFAGERLIYNHPSSGLHLDIFFDKLNFCHKISWINRLEIDQPTLPLAEMLLEKMQIVKINEKDIIDTVMLLLEHPLGGHDRETIHIDRISSLCAHDWGLWRTVTMNLGKVAQLGKEYEQLNEGDRKHLSSQVDLALTRIEAEPKTMGWKFRAKIGDRVKWYQEVDDVS
jgi:hypothetical protein